MGTRGDSRLVAEDSSRHERARLVSSPDSGGDEVRPRPRRTLTAVSLVAAIRQRKDEREGPLHPRKRGACFWAEAQPVVNCVAWSTWHLLLLLLNSSAVSQISTTKADGETKTLHKGHRP